MDRPETYTIDQLRCRYPAEVALMEHAKSSGFVLSRSTLRRAVHSEKHADRFLDLAVTSGVVRCVNSIGYRLGSGRQARRDQFFYELAG